MLRADAGNLPDGVRFQIIVASHSKPFYRRIGSIEHWFLIDFYIKHKSIDTFTVDAGGVRATSIAALKLITEYFPAGKHYCLSGGIQHLYVDCQTFTREHAAIVSDIASKTLFNLLQRNVTTNVTFASVEEKISHPSLRFVMPSDLEKENMEILAPLFRSMQSLKGIAQLPFNLRVEPVSSKGYSLTQWKDLKTTLSSRPDTIQNSSILFKDHKYFDELSRFKASHTSLEPYHHRSGFGFIRIIVKIDPYLSGKNRDSLKKIIADLIVMLGALPSVRKNKFTGGICAVKAKVILED